MAIWSNRDIKEALEKEDLKITPSPEIGTASIELHPEEVFSVKTRNPFDLRSYTNIHNPLLQGRFESIIDDLDLEKLEKQKDRWTLNKLKFYVIRYKERFDFRTEIGKLLTKRSRYARCGIGGYSQDLKDGYFHDLILPVANNAIYDDDAISQLILFDRDTKWLSPLEIEELFDNGQVSLWNEMGAEILGGRTNFTGSYIRLFLHPKVKLFQGNLIDRKNFKPQDFADFDMSVYGKISYFHYVLGRTRERARLGSRYAGLIPKADPVHHNTICYDPLILPGSDGTIVTEMFTSDPFVGFHHDLIIPLFLIPMKSSATYEGRFKKQTDVVLPW